MTEVDELRHAAWERLVPEVETAMLSAPDVRAWPPDWTTRGNVDYFYRSGSLLTSDADAGRVEDALRGLGAAPEPTHDRAARPVIKGLCRLQARLRQSQRTPHLMTDLEDRLGVGVVTHEHVLAITPRGIMCPATEPAKVLTRQEAQDPDRVRSELWPPVGDPAAGHDVRVSVVDTGLLRGVADWAPWLAGVHWDTKADVDDPDRVKVDSMKRGRDGYADPYAGHGSFVAGVIRCVAPGTEIIVERVIEEAGFICETDMITQIHDGLARSPDVISLSAGGYTRHNVPPLALRALWEDRLRHVGGLVLVAAAGNDDDTRPFWPAAFDWCVGVGSMSRDGQKRSWFSNHGSWVDVYAPGEHIVNAYPQMQYKTVVTAEVRDTSAGIVDWSGTSFATPIVSGLIAARMSRTGEDGRTAAAALLAAARGQFRPGVGPRLFP